MNQLTRRAGWLAIGLAANAAVAAPITLDAWFQGPSLRHVSISPDARYLAMVVAEGESTYVAVKDRTTTEPAKPVIAANPEQDVAPRTCNWVNAARLVCRFSGYMGKKGEGGWIARLVALDADGGDRRVLLSAPSTPFRTGPGYTHSTDHLSVSSWRAGEPDTLLITGYFPGSNGYAAARLNARTGVLRIVAKPHEPIAYFQDDGAGNVLFGAGVPNSMSRNKKIEYYARKSNDDDWKPLTRLVSHADDAHVRPLPVIAGTQTAHAIMTHNGHEALFKVDLTDSKDPEPVFWHEQRDVASVIFGAHEKLLGLTFESSVLGPQYIDPQFAALDAALRKNWPNRWNWVKDVSDDGKVFVINTTSVSEPSGFFVLDTRDSKVKFDSIGWDHPGLAKTTLPLSIPAGIRTRDGRLKEMLFTPAADPAKKAPLVVFVDGTQKTGGFEPATYFLSTRGYAVLRAYFSGTETDSDGQHRTYLDWNGKLFDELLDATSWATARPDVDGTRVCIIGRGSYGGYQALLAAARSDSPFRCAASLEGLSDLEKPRKKVERGNVIADEKPAGTTLEQIRQQSPLARAKDFRIPVLLIENDTLSRRIGDDESGREMAAALAAAGKPHKLVLIREIDEQYLRAEYAEIETFLAGQLH